MGSVEGTSSIETAAEVAEEVQEEGSVDSGFLQYPRDFFHPVSGGGPRDREAAKLLWPLRKGRPKTGFVERDEADGDKMFNEVIQMRKSLRMFVSHAFLSQSRETAQRLNLLLPSTNNKVVTSKDIRMALGCLKWSKEAEIVVYMVCHHFHRGRVWLANTVDGWLEREKMRLCDAATGPTQVKRYHRTERGGFGVVARQAKSQFVATLMASMLKRAGWCLYRKINNSSPHREYKLITVPINMQDGRTISSECYLVTVNQKRVRRAHKQQSRSDRNLNSNNCVVFYFLLLFQQELFQQECLDMEFQVNNEV